MQNTADTMLRFKGALSLKTSKEEAFHPELIKATMDVWRQMKVPHARGTGASSVILQTYNKNALLVEGRCCGGEAHDSAL